MNIDFRKYVFILCLGLFIVQPASAQNDDPTAVCANENDDISGNEDVDEDNDGLIELCYLEDLDAMRYNRYGNYLKKNLSTLSAGCLNNSCRGYELVRDLDFNDDASYISTSNKVIWTTGEGWQPIGSITAGSCTNQYSRCFSATFEGNGYRIFNLQINRGNADGIAFFDVNNGFIRNIGLSGVQVEGRRNVGGLVARNEGIIMNSNVDGSVTGTSDRVGSLVGENKSNALILNSYGQGRVVGSSLVGGLSGPNRGRIINSYATADVSGRGWTLGGLVAQNLGSLGRVINSYATGSVSSDGSVLAAERLGGLLGYIGDNAQVINSYAIGNVAGSGATIGGLIGGKGNGTRVDDSYWDADTSKQAISNGGGTSKTTVELRTPTRASDIYLNWSAANWDFGNNRSYPTLRYSEIAGVDACDSNLETALPHCGTLLPAQSMRDRGLDALFFILNDEELDNAHVFGDQPFSTLIYDYDVTIPPTEMIQLSPYTINSTATVSIMKTGDDSDYFEEKSSGDLSRAIPLAQRNEVTTLTVIVEDIRSTIYNLRVKQSAPLSISINIRVPDSDENEANEGDEIILTAEVAGGFGDFLYTWQQEDLGVNTAPNSLATLSVRVPGDFIARNMSTKSIVFTLTVSDNLSEINADTELIVRKINNGSLSFTPTVTTSTISIAVGDDPDGNGTPEYSWEQRGISDADWEEIPGAILNTYSVPPQAESNIHYRMRVNYTDAQGYSFNETLGPFRTDIDDDDDGLIDIYYLEDLDNVRHQTDGSGYTFDGAAKITLGCPNDTCIGYELSRDLDFATTQSYVDAVTNKDEWTVDNFNNPDDTGWNPISGALSAIFNGNSYTISNLQINGVDGQDAAGLFNTIESNGRVEHLSLNNVTIRGLSNSIVKVGGIAGENRGVILNSHISNGSIEGFAGVIGGLVGLNNGSNNIYGDILYSSAHADVWVKDSGSAKESRVGVLAGRNWRGGEIHNSYTIGSARGACHVGGLVGDQFSVNRSNTEEISTIKNSYAIADIAMLGSCSISGSSPGFGGLVGFNNSSDIVNSYAAGRSSIPNSGLIGTDTLTTVIDDSYWDHSKNRQSSAAGIGKSTIELQTPTEASGIYANWSAADWDFGNTMSYPALRYSEIDGVDACDSNPETASPRCGTLLSGQPMRDRGLGALFFILNNEELDNAKVFGDQPFSNLIYDYDVRIPDTETIQLNPYTINSTAIVSIMKAGDDSDYFEEKSSGDLSRVISLPQGNEPTTLTVVVEDLRPTIYNLRVNRANPLPISISIRVPDIEGNEVDEGDEITLTAEAIGGTGEYLYSWQQEDLGINMVPSSTATLSLRIPEDFISRNMSTQSIVFTLTVSNGFLTNSTDMELIVRKINNGNLSFTPTVTISTISIAVGNDPDGSGTSEYTWERRGIDNSNWEAFTPDNPNAYTVPMQAVSNTRYRVQVSHTDAQGYSFNEMLGPL